MAEVKRWSVTYTKHMKQKRKVYQDGFLELHTSTNKMLLYEDCEKLLDCRILKKDEAVCSGETLTFNAFLVEVNDAESGAGDQKPKAGVSSGENDMKFSEKRSKSWNKPQPFQTPAQNVIRGRKLLQNLSPSQNIIKEFKKRELHKYGAAISSPETVKTSTTEWQALYTTQLTQKAKKYHDGFLQLAITGSHRKQIILLDSSRNQLNSRFLKKDEVIASGGSIAFDAHLVDIGEQEGDHKFARDLHLKEDKRNVVGKTRIKQEEGNGVLTGKDGGKEWKVLYTTQVTQKAKKYHDGFLQLASRGSFGRQAMLYDATRKLLETRFLKKDEAIRSGESFAFGAHLVDIGEPEGNEAGADLKCEAKDFCVQKSRKLHGEDDCIIIDDFEVKGEEKSQKKASLKKALNSNFSISSVQETKPSRGVPTNKLIRDAHQILSFLQNPMDQESVASRQANSTARPVSSTKGSQVSDAIMLDISEGVRPSQSQSSEPHNRSVENIEPGNITETGNKELAGNQQGISFKLDYAALSSGCGSQLAESEDIKNFHQVHSDHVKADTARHNADCVSDESRSSSCVSHVAADNEKIVSQEPSCARKVERPSFELEGPSFDLGF